MNTLIAERTVNVLDHGYVKLNDYMGDEIAISNAARTTVTWEDWRGEDDIKLIRYMFKNKHTSPFEHVEFSFHIKCPLFIARQWHRHRTWSYNEISGRYQELPEEFYVPKPEHIGIQDSKNHQSRRLDDAMGLTEAARAIEITKAIDECCKGTFAAYKHMLALGVPREIARGVLPLNTYTRYYAKVDLHNLLHFIGLRAHSHAQYEIRVYAEAMLELITPIVPNVISVFKEVNGIA